MYYTFKKVVELYLKEQQPHTLNSVNQHILGKH